MQTTLDRIRLVFRNSRLSQTKIAEKLDVTPQYIWKLLNVDGIEPSERVILATLKEFNIAEEWLRTGNGDMHVCSPADLADITAELYRCKDSMSDEELKQLEEFLKLYATMDDETRQAFYTIALNMTKK